ncbi:hypothetical protein B0T22DRAFT_469582 [Podospora appendiculata]|uniref:Uncharacterized protein n=1 Tax=Podospora appendiculata TaxID=314037 RepID=A0AAE0X3M6_9PEZI|nr:hypothetical protein B0T22DRAFT_469582 [Podospora appendiculata]
MTSTPSIASSDISGHLSTSSTTIASGWFDHVLRKKYRDPSKFKETLNRIYGEGDYQIKVRRDRWILALRRPMRPGEMEEIEKDTIEHY